MPLLGTAKSRFSVAPSRHCVLLIESRMLFRSHCTVVRLVVAHYCLAYSGSVGEMAFKTSTSERKEHPSFGVIRHAVEAPRAQASVETTVLTLLIYWTRHRSTIGFRFSETIPNSFAKIHERVLPQAPILYARPSQCQSFPERVSRVCGCMEEHRSAQNDS